MGHLLKITNKKYRIWSTITDSYLTKPLTKDELFRYLFWERFENLIEEIGKDFLTFPYGWTEKTTQKRFPCKKTQIDKFYTLLNNREEMYELVFKKLKNMGISIEIKDTMGVHLYTK